jgi:cytochrome P450
MDDDLATQRSLNELVFALYQHAQSMGRAGGAIIGESLLWNIMVIHDPLKIEKITKRPHQFKKNFAQISAMGASRFIADGKEWETRRDLTQGTYNSASKSTQRPHISKFYHDEFERCDANFGAIQDALVVASMRVFFDAFEIDLPIHKTAEIIERMRLILVRLQHYSWVKPDEAESARVVLDAHELTAEFAQHLKQTESGRTLVENFEQKAASIENFSAEDEFLFNLFGGMETTVATSSWVLDRLAMNANVEARVYEEIMSGGKTPYTDCMINETMRYLPTIPFVVRQVVEDISLDGIDYPKDQIILLSIISAHHHPDYWKDPHIFDSSRSEFMNDSYDRRAFIPFLSGPRMCGGARLARAEIYEAVKAAVQLFQFTRHDDIVQFDYGLALKPQKSTKISVVRRDK